MTDERTLKTLAAARDSGAEWALLTSPDAVSYACGYVASIEAGPSPFDGGPTAALIGPDGEATVLTTDLERAQAEASGVPLVESYESFGFREHAPLAERYSIAARRLLGALPRRGRVAVQARSLPWTLAEALHEHGVSLAPFDEPLARERARKTATEIEALRRCATLTTVGQRAVRGLLHPDVSELELFTAIRHQLETAAGERLPVAGDLVSGRERTAAIGGWPTSRRIGAGDPVIVDLAPRVGGYWGDSCTTVSVGAPDDELKRFHAVAVQALERARDLLSPGRAIATVDEQVRAVIERAGLHDPIHLGHSIGTSVHEWPRIVPGGDGVLEPSMVLMIEPGAYDLAVGGVRVEQMFLITETGAECLSAFDTAFFNSED